MPDNAVKYKFDDSRTTILDLSEANGQTVLSLADGQGATVGTLTNDTVGTTAEDAYLSVTIGGQVYKIPAWLDD